MRSLGTKRLRGLLGFTGSAAILRRSLIGLVVLGLAALGAIAIATACGGEAKPSALSKSGQVMFFGLTLQNPYAAGWRTGATAQAKKFGWTLRYVEVTKSQSQQDSQITQLLESGKKPVGIILNPFEGPAAAASMLAIKKAGIPLVIIDAEPPASQRNLFDMYVGADAVLGSRVSVQLVVREAKKKNITLKNGLIIGCPWDYEGCITRRVGFVKALAKLAPGAKVVKSYASKGFGPTEAYDTATQVIPAQKGKFNFVYTINDGLGLGVIKALKENGLTPGKDVLVVGGVCLGEAATRAAINGDFVGTAVQSPTIEAALGVINIAQFRHNDGRVKAGKTYVSEKQPPSINQLPYKYNYIPDPVVGNSAAGFQKAKIWGQTAQKLCNYTG